MTGVWLREHTLNRLTYGPNPADRARYDQHGHTYFVRQQLGLQPIALAPVSPWVGSMQSLGSGKARIEKGVARMVHRAIGEEHQLAMVLSDLFFNHLNVFSAMGVSSWTFDRYLNEAINPHVLGRFSDMLRASSTQPAMLHYLDNKKNKVGANNQNYAREVMELHTVGVGNHDEDDVREATRILTGWTLTDQTPNADDPTWVEGFNNNRHDFSDKEVLDVEYKYFTDGAVEIEQFLGNLAQHPKTAERIVAKLHRRFFGEGHVASNPLEIASKAIYHHSHTNISYVLQNILLNYDFDNPAIFRNRIKPPHRFVASAFRAFGLTPSEADIGDDYIDELLAIGDQPYFYGPPTGFPDASAYWLTGNGMLSRFQMAEQLAEDVLTEAKAVTGITAKDDMGSINQKLIRHLFAGGASVVSGGVPGFPTIPAWAISNDSAKTAYYYARDGKTLDEKVKRALTILFSTPEFLRY